MNKETLSERLKYNCDLYCQSYNIKKYKIVNNRYLIYNISFHGDCLNLQRRYTIQHTVDLETLQEVSIKPLKRFDKEALQNGGIAT